MNGDSGQYCRAPSSICSVPSAFTSKSRNGIDGRPIVRRLRGRVDDQVGSDLAHQGEESLAVADVDRFVTIARYVAPEPFRHPGCVALGTEKDGAVVAVDSNDAKTLTGEEGAHFRTDQAARA